MEVLRLSNNLQPTVHDFIKNFPFPTRRESQSHVLNEIANAFASDYKYILLEAPTGFGKSPVAIAAGLTLGISYRYKKHQSYSKELLTLQVLKVWPICNESYSIRVVVLELRKEKDNRQRIGDHNRMFNEMNHWLNIFWHCEFSIITLDHNLSKLQPKITNQQLHNASY